jgi:hypothetical protein
VLSSALSSFLRLSVSFIPDVFLLSMQHVVGGKALLDNNVYSEPSGVLKPNAPRHSADFQTITLFSGASSPGKTTP